MSSQTSSQESIFNEKILCNILKMKLCIVDVMKIPSYCDNFITKQCFYILYHFLNIFCQFTHNIAEFRAFSSITLSPAETLLPNTLPSYANAFTGGLPEFN